MTQTDKLVLLERINALASGILEQLEKWKQVESRDELLALQEMTRQFGEAIRSTYPVVQALKASQGALS